MLQVAVDDSGRLVVRPETGDFSDIYRTASGVHWDEAQQSLIGTAQQKWAVARWFKQFATAMESEYHTVLEVGPWTRWSNVDDEARFEIESITEHNVAAAILDPGDQKRSVENLMFEQALSKAASLWNDCQYADYVGVLSQYRARLSPAQIKRMNIAERRSRR